MRVNVDSAALRDPRMKLLGRTLGMSEPETIGRCLMVWLVCYERRSALLQQIEIDISADRDGFAEAMIRSGLAENDEDGDIYIRGVTERIEFLERQSERGKLSGESRRKRAKPQGPGTDVQPTLNLGSEPVERTLNERSRSRSTNSLTLSPDQAPDQDQDHPPRLVIDPTPQGQKAHSVPAAAREKDGAPDSEPEPEKRATGKPAREVPDQAVTLAHLLLGLITTNNPGARISKAPPKVREHTADKWAEVIDKLQRLDGFSWGEIEGMIVWCQRDTFWRGVILGADNLRDKWDKMAAQRDRPGRPTSQPAQGFDDVLDDAARQLNAKQKPTTTEPTT